MESEDLLIAKKLSLSNRPWRMGIHGMRDIWLVCKRSRQPKGNTFYWRKDRYYVYTEEAARTLGITFIDWFRVREAGQHGLSDDGYVSQCIRVNELVNKEGEATVELTWPTAKMFLRQKGDSYLFRPWELMKYSDKKYWNGRRPEDYWRMFLRRKNVQEGIQMLVRVYVQRFGQLTDADALIIFKTLWPKRKLIGRPSTYINVFLNNNLGIRQYVERMIRQAFTEVNLTPETAARELKRLLLDEKSGKTVTTKDRIAICRMVFDAFTSAKEGESDPERLKEMDALATLHESTKQEKLNEGLRRKQLIGTSKAENGVPAGV